MKQTTILFFITLFFSQHLTAQEAGDCPYPIIFLHGFISDHDAWKVTYSDSNFVKAWGGLSDTFFAVVNANEQTNLAGVDNILGNNDDDVLVQFVNENNDLASGCLYASDWRNFWNEDENNPVIGKLTNDTIYDCDAPGGPFAAQSPSNQSSYFKQAYALGIMIDKVLAANPTKEKVILIGHSAGGSLSREYLQRDNAPTENGRWWIGNHHRVAKLVTVGTPHLGSNFFGNPFPQKAGNNTPMKTGIPDPNSELARDLRYSSFLSSLSCNTGFAPNHGVYLFGGEEACIADNYNNDDVNCNGSEGDFVVGVNIDGTLMGFNQPESGTYDNPEMPLPLDVQYTWITHDVGTGGDLVVALERQWIYQDSIPHPIDSNMGAYYLADTLLSNYNHIEESNDVYTAMRGLDEADYPVFAYSILPNHTYGGTTTLRSQQVNYTSQPSVNSDPDWYKVHISTQSWNNLELRTFSDVAGQIDLYTEYPGDLATQNADLSLSFNGADSLLQLPHCNDLDSITYYIRITHYELDNEDWKNPYQLRFNSFEGLNDENENGISDECESVQLSLKAFLEGPYEASTLLMTTNLNAENLLPNTSPYSIPPYNLIENDTLFEIPENMVDWILVEVRSTIENPNPIARRSALLMNDGSIRDLDGISDLSMDLPPHENYFIVLRHRNHLDIISANAIPRSLNMSYDFSTSIEQAYGPEQQKTIGTNAVMYTGDINQDWVIQNTDYDQWFFNSAILDQYLNTDLNLDGVSQTTDYDFWFLNKAKVGISFLAY